MSLLRGSPIAAALIAAAAVAAASQGCSGGGATGVGGAGGAGAATTATTSATASSSATTGAGGTGGSGPAIEPSGFSCSPAKPTLSADIVPITSPNCGTAAACHLAMVSGNGVYDQLVNRIAEECDDLRLMINPGDPEHSYVIHKLTGHNLCSPATTMPLDSAPLSKSEIQTIYDWICEGAPND